MKSIPKTIHLIGAGKTPPPRYSGFIDRMRELHPAWEIVVWDDAAAAAIVDRHFPGWKQCYRAYSRPVQRADIFRAIVMYLYGGFYLDMDMFCLKRLDELCSQHIVLGIEKTLSQDECIMRRHRHRVRIANYMFGSRPGHLFWLDFLSAAKEKAQVVIREEADVLETTGPGLFTNVYHENEYRYKNILVLANKDKACLKSCGPASCHFGDYAVHLHLGSWRWEGMPVIK